MAIEDHVARELELLVEKPGADELTRSYAKALMEAYEVFQKNDMYTHGLIVNSALHMFNRLLNWLPLDELHSFQEHPEEWTLVEDDGDGKRCYQNNRCTKLFFYEDSGVYRDVNCAVFHDNICKDVGFTANHLRSEYVEKFKTELDALGIYPMNSAQNVTMPYYPPDKAPHYYYDWYQFAFVDALDTFGDLVTHRKRSKNNPNTAKNLINHIVADFFPTINDGKIFIGAVNVHLMATVKDELFIMIDLVPIDDKVDVIPLVYRFDSVDRQGNILEDKIVPYFQDTIKTLFRDLEADNVSQSIFVVPIEDVEGARELPVLLPIHDSENMFNAVKYFTQVGFEHTAVINTRGLENLTIVDAHDFDALKKRYQELKDLPVVQQSAAEKRTLEYLMDRRSMQMVREAKRAKEAEAAGHPDGPYGIPDPSTISPEA